MSSDKAHKVQSHSECIKCIDCWVLKNVYRFTVLSVLGCCTQEKEKVGLAGGDGTNDMHKNHNKKLKEKELYIIMYRRKKKMAAKQYALTAEEALKQEYSEGFIVEKIVSAKVPVAFEKFREVVWLKNAGMFFISISSLFTSCVFADRCKSIPLNGQRQL